jgi:3-hydroxyacyl-[acyl-carrier-protein] dehydratase
MSETILYNFSQIAQVLPQKNPFIMVDQVVSLTPNVDIVAKKNVSPNEPFFPGHFPGNPIMPGVLIIEGMAQSAILLFVFSNDKSVEERPQGTYFLASVRTKFVKPVFPGDTIFYHLQTVKMLSNCAVVEAIAYVNEVKTASATLSFFVDQNEQTVNES